MRRAIAPICLAALAALAAGGCARSGPPAPVEFATPVVASGQVQQVGPGATRTTVQAGENLYAVARRTTVPVRDLIEANGLGPPFKVAVGQSLVVPAAQTHLVQPGETIYSISRALGADTTEIARANALQPPYALKVGQLVKVPRAGAAPLPAAEPATHAPAAPAPAAKPAAPVTVAPLAPPPAAPVPSPEPERTAALTPPPPPPRGAAQFLWPVRGKLISHYGAKPGGLYNDGINVAAPRGSPVHAVDNGVVVYAGNELKGYGNLLLVRHAGGWVSAYAHNEELLVGRGAQVHRGQLIAKVGATGNVSEPQLHFELRQGSGPVDPLPHLGPPEAAQVSVLRRSASGS